MAKITVKGVGAVKTKPDYVEILLSLNVVDKDYTAAVNKGDIALIQELMMRSNCLPDIVLSLS